LKNVVSLATEHLSDAVVVLGPNGHRDIHRRFQTEGIRELPQPIDRATFTRSDDGALREELGTMRTSGYC
jgi:hypothetical protein